MLTVLSGALLVSSLLILIFFGPEWLATQMHRARVFRKVRPPYRMSLPRHVDRNACQ